MSATYPGPCPCECNLGGFCGGCGHAGCGARRPVDAVMQRCDELIVLERRDEQCSRQARWACWVPGLPAPLYRCTSHAAWYANSRLNSVVRISAPRRAL